MIDINQACAPACFFRGRWDDVLRRETPPVECIRILYT